MELTVWIDTLLAELPKLWQYLKSVTHQINTAFLVCCSTLFIPLLILLVKAGVYVVEKGQPLGGRPSLSRWSTASFTWRWPLWGSSSPSGCR